MKRMNKKGISAIVATVLIILITVAAVTIIWAAIIPMISENLDKATRCGDATSQLTLKEDYTCWHSSGSSSGNMSVQVSRGSGSFELADIKVILSIAGNDENYMILDNTSTPASGGQYQLGDFPEINENKVFLINKSIEKPDTVRVTPVIVSGQVLTECEASGRIITVRNCTNS